MKKYLNYIEKYLGGKKIKRAIESSEETFRGKPIVTITLEDDTVENLPLAVADNLVSKDPMDATTRREAEILPLTKEIIGVLLESQIKVDDIDFLFTKATESVNKSLELADDKLWNMKRREKTLADVDKVLTSKKE